jgi:hypothetical protein
MEAIKNFINENLSEFSNLSSNEVIEYTLNEFSDDVIDYLKTNDRFDHENICIYYVEDDNEIWIENMI